MTKHKAGNAGKDDESGNLASLRDEQKQLTHNRLLAAATRLFEQHGYAATTVQDITKGANASRATFYLHFKSKADLLNALVDQLRPDVEAYYSDLDRVLTSGSEDDLRDWVRKALVEWFGNDRGTVMLALEHALLSGGELGEELSPVSYHAEYMPHYLDRWPAKGKREAQLRVWLFSTLLVRVNTAWIADSMPDISQNLLVEVITDLADRLLLQDGQAKS